MWSSRFNPVTIADRLAQAAGRRQSRWEPVVGEEVKPRPASVLLPLLPPGYDSGGDQASSWRLLFIRRADHPHDRHSGEVAFPGGRADPGDHDPVATALREAEEEIGLESRHIQVLGQLGPFTTVSGYRVTPVVGLVTTWPLALRPDPSEVAEIFSLPLDWLREPAHRHTRLWPAPGHPQAREVIFYQERDGRRLWGVSAWITVDFLGCLEPWD
jgi:8-oxo-dGTP pyrophosphatase MutT (NUDIX family)